MTINLGVCNSCEYFICIPVPEKSYVQTNEKVRVLFILCVVLRNPLETIENEKSSSRRANIFRIGKLNLHTNRCNYTYFSFGTEFIDSRHVICTREM